MRNRAPVQGPIAFHPCSVRINPKGPIRSARQQVLDADRHKETMTTSVRLIALPVNHDKNTGHHRDFGTRLKPLDKVLRLISGY